MNDQGSATPGSSSLRQPDYWWYRARAGLLQAALGRYVDDPERVLDVGSADGPSVGWMTGRHHASVDLDPSGLAAGTSVCASALALPFCDGAFDVVSAFDVLEHCEPESTAIAELARVVAPGGHLLMSVPAYQWAWTDHDVRAGHHRRYTRGRLLAAVATTGLHVVRCSYAFGAVFPFFAAERLARRRRTEDPTAPNRLPDVPPVLDHALSALCSGEERVLRRYDLPFGSSIVLAATRDRRSR